MTLRGVNVLLSLRKFEDTMMVKIKLTRHGDILTTQTVCSFSDKVDYGAKQHELCLGFLDLIKTTETHQVLSCRKCNFRFQFPIEILTYAELKTCAAQRIKQQAARNEDWLDYCD